MYTHDYMPDVDNANRCVNGWRNSRWEWVECRSTQESSVLHTNPDADFRQRHDHGGGDCMCFEDPEGPDYYAAMQENRGDWVPPVPKTRAEWFGRCDFCGETFRADAQKAEVVRWQDWGKPDAKHLIVHAEEDAGPVEYSNGECFADPDHKRHSHGENVLLMA